MARKAEGLARKARIACEKWRQYFKYNIDKYHKMHSFVLGHQWEEDEKDMLITNNKVALTSNKLATLSNSLSGEQQQNTPQLQVTPMSNCTEETAYFREIILKDIVFSTDSNTVYQVSGSQASIGGFGAFAVGTDYLQEDSFDQDIVTSHFKDSTRAYWDIGAENISKIDGMYGGYISRITRQKFRELYGKQVEEKIMTESGITATESEIALATQPEMTDDPFSWADDESITINDFFLRKFKKETIYKLSNGKTVNQEEMDDIISQSQSINDMESMLPAEGIEELNSVPEEDVEEELLTLWSEGEQIRIEEKREIKKSRIMHYRIAGEFVLEESEFPSDDIPVIFVDQKSYYDKNGKQVCRSFFDDCVDTQRYINYLRTQSAYILKISRYDQFMGSKENVRGLDTERNWQDPTNIQGMLTYDESPQGNKPEQIRPPELSQSLFQQYQLAIEDLYSSTGLYPTRMGQQGNEVSGEAINARTRQGSYVTQGAFTSVNRAIEAAGVIINQMIPKVYDSERVISLMTPDEGMKTITINKQSDEYGAFIENDIRKGTYQVRLKPGPSYEGQKQEALMSLQQVLQANPQAFNLIADLYAENLPLANSIELKNRLKTMVPPEIIQAGKTGKNPQEMGAKQPSPEEQAMQAEMQMKQQELQLKQQELQLKAKQMEIELQMHLQKLETERLEVAGKLEEQKLRYLAETERTQSDNAISHADNLTKILTHRM